MNFICEGLDRVGKDSLIEGIINSLGYYTVLHRSKPPSLKYYQALSINYPNNTPEFLYQQACFSQDMALLKNAELSKLKLIFNRSWIGEAVWANMYRGYDGNYVFDLEKIAGVDLLNDTRLILLTENFTTAKHFVDDGESLGPIEKREEEQKRFLCAFEKSNIRDKKIICVTNSSGEFRSKEEILMEALS